jgi:hypothetical protein
MTTIPLVANCEPVTKFAIRSFYGRLKQFSVSNARADVTSYFREIYFFSFIE